ncbi:MAG: hypothetical protein WCK05_10430 [Planctomycetota bacterium]
MAFNKFQRSLQRSQQSNQQNNSRDDEGDEKNLVDLISLDGKTPSIIKSFEYGEVKYGVAVTQWAELDGQGIPKKVHAPSIGIFSNIGRGGWTSSNWSKFNGKAKGVELDDLLAAMLPTVTSARAIKDCLMDKWEAKWGARTAAKVPESNPAETMERLRRLAGIGETATPTPIAPTPTAALPKRGQR